MHGFECQIRSTTIRLLLYSYSRYWRPLRTGKFQHTETANYAGSNKPSDWARAKFNGDAHERLNHQQTIAEILARTHTCRSADRPGLDSEFVATRWARASQTMFRRS